MSEPRLAHATRRAARAAARLASRTAARCRALPSAAATIARRWWRGERPPVARPGLTLRLQAAAYDGRLGSWPLMSPRRGFELYLPACAEPGASMPLLVWIHGCKQTVADFAAGTRIREHADARGIAVLMPDQSRFANPSRCWNWFDAATADGRGEAAIVLAQIALVIDTQSIDADRIWIAGLSSGAALAAAVALAAPERFAALGCHSGLPAGAARSLSEARRAMADGTTRDVASLGTAARERAGIASLPVLVIQGSGDASVAPANADALVAQALALNGDAAPGTAPGTAPRAADAVSTSTIGTRTIDQADWQVDGRLAVRRLRVEGLAHAWSGGDPALPYFDPAPPDATELMLAFFERHGVVRAALAAA